MTQLEKLHNAIPWHDMPTHPTTGERDSRYSLQVTFMGHPEPSYLASFAGETIGNAQTTGEAVRICIDHQHKRGASA